MEMQEGFIPRSLREYTANIGRNAAQNQVCLEHQYITTPPLSIYSLSLALQFASQKCFWNLLPMKDYQY